MKQNKKKENHKLNFRLCATHSLCDLASNFFSIFIFLYLRNKQNIVMKHKKIKQKLFKKKQKKTKKPPKLFTLLFFWGDFAVEIVLKLPSIIEKD